MKLSTSIHQGNKYLTIDLDSDMYMMLSSKFYPYRLFYNHIAIKNKKGIRIPVWRIVRKCFNKDLTCRYKDGDNTNLKRENIELIRKT